MLKDIFTSENKARKEQNIIWLYHFINIQHVQKSTKGKLYPMMNLKTLSTFDYQKIQ